MSTWKSPEMFSDNDWKWSLNMEGVWGSAKEERRHSKWTDCHGEGPGMEMQMGDCETVNRPLKSVTMLVSEVEAGPKVLTCRIYNEGLL